MGLKSFLLAPVLVVQAFWVKLKTPKLPEYKQPKNLLTNNKHIPIHQAAFSLLLIGDSSAAGVGALSFESSLMGQLIEQMDVPFNYNLCANSGDTTQLAIDQLNKQTDQYFDIVITALGVNDVISRIKPPEWITQQKKLISRIKKKHKAELIIVCGLPPMHKFPSLPPTLRKYLADKATQMDRALETLIKQETCVQYFPLHNFPENIPAASDGFHPGPAAYHHWAKRLCQTITRHFGWH